MMNGKLREISSSELCYVVMDWFFDPFLSQQIESSDRINYYCLFWL